MSEHHEVIVVGAGVSGVTFAHLCARSGKEVLLLESADTAGGCVQSVRLDGGFWCELGAHTCYNSYGALLSMLEPAGAIALQLRRRKAPYRLWTDGRLQSPISQVSIGELLLHMPRMVTTRKKGLTVQGYWGALVGKRNYGRVFRRLFAAVFSQPADAFPADMMFKKRPRRKDVPRSYTFRGGLSSMIDALVASPRLTLRSRSAVRAVSAGSGDTRVELEDGSVLEARHVCIAAPPAAAAQMLAGAFPVVAGALARIGSVAVESTAVVVRAADVPFTPVAGIISLDDGFFSAVSRDTVADDQWRAFSFHFAPGRAEHDRIEQAARVLGVAPACFQHVSHRRVALPAPVLGHESAVAEIERALADTPLYLTGNYFGGLAIEDCALRSCREHERLSNAASNV